MSIPSSFIVLSHFIIRCNKRIKKSDILREKKENSDKSISVKTSFAMNDVWSGGASGAFSLILAGDKVLNLSFLNGTGQRKRFRAIDVKLETL
ncbi:unnamed protein product [Caenorhabditis nigoni]